MVHKKHFSLVEAIEELIEILPMLNEIAGLKQRLDEKGYDVYKHQYFGGMGPNGEKFFPQEMEDLAALAQNIERRGVQLKGLENGLIDFPHIRANGEEVYLCYQLGDPEVLYWHTIEAGFAGRQPLDTL